MNTIANFSAIDFDEKKEKRRYFRIGFPLGNFGVYFYVYKEYPAFTEQDAIDTFADYAIGAAPGYCLADNDAHILELRADAIADGCSDPDQYVDEYYMRAGNDSHYILMSTCIDEISEAELEFEEGETIESKVENFIINLKDGQK